MAIAEDACTSEVRDVSDCDDPDPAGVLSHGPGSTKQDTQIQIWMKRVSNGL